MASSISESSHGSSGSSSSVTPSPADELFFWLLWHRWRPGWYVFVLAVNATAAALLFPRPDPHYVEGQVGTVGTARTYFIVLMLASLGSGCMAACLRKRAGASPHVKSASDYAILNWCQSLLVTMAVRPIDFSYGVLPPYAYHYDGGLWSTESIFYSSVAVCRGILYGLGSICMQKLIASRLELLELSSSQAFGGRCICCLVRVQACTASVAVISLSLGFCYELFPESPWKVVQATQSLAILAGFLTAIVNVLTSMMAACFLTKSLLVLRRVLRMAKLNDASVAAQLSLRRARRLAGLQTMGVSCSLVLTILVIPCALLSHTHAALGIPLWAAVGVQAVDVLGNALAAVLLSGGHRLPKVDQVPGQQLCCWACRCQTKAPLEQERDWSPMWRAKVEELSLRGMTLRSLLCFYQETLLPMPGWKYAPSDHKTRDVVRRAIIPLTSREESAYAVSALNRDGPRRAQVMVTHNWGNCCQG